MPGLVRFGPFALDTETADLSGNGRVVRLPEQQFRILQLLIQRDGGVVSRDEIRRALWPNDTVVEWDRSINAAILKLRSALKDSSSEEGFIETVPRRGYRFILPPGDFGEGEGDRSEPVDQHCLTGQRISHYSVLGVLGGGGTSLVYKAEDLKLNRAVALKFLAGGTGLRPSTLLRLEQEARTASALNHPNICTIYEIGEHEGRPFIAMEFLDGETLREWIARLHASHHGRESGLPVRQLLGIAIQIAEGLSAAHARGIIHGDIKPANVFLTATGTVKLLDFGLARQSEDSAVSATAREQSSRRKSRPSGTPDYMSPEQANGERLDHRSDIFSFGILLAELFTGSRAFGRESGSALDFAEFPDHSPLSAEIPPGLVVVLRRLLVKSRDLRYQSMGELLTDLKRIEKLVSASQRTAGPKEVPLIGREHELAELTGMLSEAMAGHGGIVLIGGEPGIGKSHLARSVLKEARRRGALGVIGHCYEMEGAPAYAPFVEMLEYIWRMAPREGFRYSLGDYAPEVARLMPELRNIYPDIPPAIQLPPEQERRFFFNGFRSFVERAASVTPLVVVFEDLQWADEPTLLLLEHHAQTLSNTPMLVIATYRDFELEVSRPFARTLERLVRERQATRMPLRRLPQEGVKAMLNALSGQPPPSALVRAIFDETEGNPFFVEEVFRYLDEEGKLFDQNGKWLADIRMRELQVPVSVRLVIGRRFSRLGEETHRVLTTASVMGRSFNLRLLEELENARPDAALDAIEEAERAHLVVHEPDERDARYRFVHELVRQTLSESLSFPRRQRLHLRIADAIEKVHEGRLESYATQLAHHLYEAGASASREKTTQYLLLAAHRARAGSAHEEALEHLERALSLWEDVADRQVAILLFQKASTLRSLGRADGSISAYRKAISIFESTDAYEQMAEASIALSYVQAWRLDADAARSTMERAHKAALDHAPQLVRNVLSMRAAITSASGDPATAERMFDEARQLDQGAVMCSQEPMPMLEAIHYYQSFQLEKVRHACPRVAAACLQTGDAWNASSVEFYGIWAEMYCGNPEGGAAALPEALHRAERIGHYGAIWALKIAASVASAASGDLERSRAETAEAWEFGAEHDVGWNFAASLQRGHFALWGGKLAEAEACYQQGLKLEGKSYLSGVAEASLFAAYAECGDPRAAEMWNHHRWQHPVAGQLNSLGAWNALERTIVGLARLGRKDEVAALRSLTDELILTGAWTYTILSPFQTIAGIAAACAADWEAAEAHHLAAIHQTDTSPYRHLSPVAREWYAHMLLDRDRPGDAGKAQEILRQAVKLFDTGTFAARGAQARALLAML